MEPVPKMNTGDTVWWHVDMYHAAKAEQYLAIMRRAQCILLLSR